jgi:hypothetical protein
MTDNLAIETKSDKNLAVPLTADEQLLHTLGYKQEFKREFTAFEVFGKHTHASCQLRVVNFIP